MIQALMCSIKYSAFYEWRFKCAYFLVYFFVQANEQERNSRFSFKFKKLSGLTSFIQGMYEFCYVHAIFGLLFYYTRITATPVAY